jgi:hypothetical protein
MKQYFIALVLVAWLLALPASADVGDPQVRTDHPWYPGELAFSTFERLFATQAALYERVTGTRPTTEEQKVLAAWLWRNTHYFHAEEGAQDLWGKGFANGDAKTREYWTGFFAHGFGLCGTTHAQWVAEMEALLGHSTGRVAGCDGHNSFEAFLHGGPYGKGKWVLVDHDVSSVIYNARGTALVSLADVARDWKQLADRRFAPGRQHGWLICGLFADDAGCYRHFGSVEYLAGYSGPPPMVHLRRGETLRRYLEPGLEDGKTFVFWGANNNAGGIPGPERAETWVNQPDKMYGSKDGTGHHPGQARYGNAVYTYRLNSRSGNYGEGVLHEKNGDVVFEFDSPYIIAATPPNNKPWGIYDPGCRNGLVLRGGLQCPVAVSIDNGQTWSEAGKFEHGLDLTDLVKGRRHYLLRLKTPARTLRNSNLEIRTVCQANPSIMPRLKDGGCKVDFLASGQAMVSAGPELRHAESRLVAGKFGTPQITLKLTSPQQHGPFRLYAAAHIQSSSPPQSDIKYQIEYSLDGGKAWRPVVKDWNIPRRGEEPTDFWSQSFCWGSVKIDGRLQSILVRFRNDGGKAYLRCEAHLVYRVAETDPTSVTFYYTDNVASHQARHVFRPGDNTQWVVPTGKNVRTHWVEMTPATGPAAGIQ